MSNKITCLFGFHKYTIPWKENKDVLICENCRRVGYYKNTGDGNVWYNRDEVWYTFNEKGNMTHKRYADGFELWWDDVEWSTKKPRNWKYENV